MVLKEKVTIEREVTGVIADLVHFARRLQTKEVWKMTDAELVAEARDFWDSRHGECD